VGAVTDVVVAGSGGAGLTAALAAAVQGADVVLVERGARLGGTTALSGGRVWIPGRGGDGPAAAAAYLGGIFSGRYPEMTAAFIASGPEMKRFVEEHSAHRFAECPRYPDYFPARPGGTAGGRALDMEPLAAGERVGAILEPPGYLPMSFAEWETWRYPARFDWELLKTRTRTGVRTGGVALVAGLLDGVVRAGVRIMTGTRLTDVRPGAAVLAGGTVLEARSVILATGGFDWDRELRRAHQPRAGHATGAPPTNTGDALRIAWAAGAAVDNLDQGWWMPMVAIPGEMLDGEQFFRSLIRERGLPRQIMVDAAGRRFVNEALPYNEIGKALQQRGGPVYLIFDSGYLDRYPMPGMSAVVRADTIGDLARSLNVPAPALRRTAEEWNEACGIGVDAAFRRGEGAYERFCGDPSVRPNPCLGPIDAPPYYAIEVLSGTIGTKGGPVTTTDGVVVRADGSLVEGLYAVGNAAAFWTADGYPGPGATLGVGMTMGYRAGVHAGRRSSGPPVR
jgi:succinate dehydrogenase/fumarate reductase flavoprotein subunit